MKLYNFSVRKFILFFAIIYCMSMHTLLLATQKNCLHFTIQASKPSNEKIQTVIKFIKVTERKKGKLQLKALTNAQCIDALKYTLIKQHPIKTKYTIANGKNKPNTLKKHPYPFYFGKFENFNQILKSYYSIKLCHAGNQALKKYLEIKQEIKIGSLALKYWICLFLVHHWKTLKESNHIKQQQNLLRMVDLSRDYLAKDQITILDHENKKIGQITIAPFFALLMPENLMINYNRIEKWHLITLRLNKLLINNAELHQIPSQPLTIGYQLYSIPQMLTIRYKRPVNYLMNQYHPVTTYTNNRKRFISYLTKYFHTRKDYIGYIGTFFQDCKINLHRNDLYIKECAVYKLNQAILVCQNQLPLIFSKDEQYVGIVFKPSDIKHAHKLSKEYVAYCAEKPRGVRFTLWINTLDLDDWYVEDDISYRGCTICKKNLKPGLLDVYCCQGTFYCDEECQKIGWKKGHREICIRKICLLTEKYEKILRKHIWILHEDPDNAKRFPAMDIKLNDTFTKHLITAFHGVILRVKGPSKRSIFKQGKENSNIKYRITPHNTINTTCGYIQKKYKHGLIEFLIRMLLLSLAENFDNIQNPQYKKELSQIGKEICYNSILKTTQNALAEHILLQDQKLKLLGKKINKEKEINEEKVRFFSVLHFVAKHRRLINH